MDEYTAKAEQEQVEATKKNSVDGHLEVRMSVQITSGGNGARVGTDDVGCALQWE